MKKCVIFDMDGVIINSEPIHQLSERKLFDLLEITITEEEHNDMVGTTDLTMWERIEKSHPLPITIPQIIQLKKSIYMEYLKSELNIKPIPYVSELIADLHKNEFILALASSSPLEQIEYILSLLNLNSYFNAIVSGDDVKSGKPHPEIFLKAAQKLNLDPKNCVVIEDSCNGVMAAKNANMKCIAYSNPSSGVQNLNEAIVVIHSFKELSSKFILDLLKCESSIEN
jgi:beta-phosphoglucomutase family hydrolase